MNIKTLFATLWVVFTVSMIGWWWFYGLDQLSVPLEAHVYLKRQRMLFWEGISFLIAQMLGGAGLFYFMKQDEEKNKSLRNFFSGFSHDLRTSISRLRLQCDVLLEDEKLQSHKNLHRLVKTVNQLDLQLENSLWMAQIDEFKLIKQKFPLSRLISEVKNEFFELSIELNKDIDLNTDYRSLLFVFRNLLHNSVIHGKATHVLITVESDSTGAKILFRDNGVGCARPITLQGFATSELKGKNSSGIGLYLCAQIFKKMGGKIEIENSPTGFGVRLCL